MEASASLSLVLPHPLPLWRGFLRCFSQGRSFGRPFVLASRKNTPPAERRREPSGSIMPPLASICMVSSSSANDGVRPDSCGPHKLPSHMHLCLPEASRNHPGNLCLRGLTQRWCPLFLAVCSCWQERVVFIQGCIVEVSGLLVNPTPTGMSPSGWFLNQAKSVPAPRPSRKRRP